ncbi:MAG: class I SAM-dependent methyltransferase [Candidatus Brocadiaceae bacterium]|nr:class I SAM-dependent methyltransferase [Candidatus Brocadiaceae bacterium]
MNTEGVYCGICGGARECMFKLYDDRYGYPGTFSLFRCQSCGHKNIHSSVSPEKIKEMYSKYYPRATFHVDDHKPYREIEGFTSWFDGMKSGPFRWVPDNVRVLDIGCGFGESLGYYASRGCEAYGVEVDANIKRVADAFGYNVKVGLFSSDAYQEDFFDYVTMAQVIEHVTDPIATLKGIARILKPGGAVVLSMPNSNGWGAKIFRRMWINWHIPYHIQHFSFKSIRIAAERSSLILDKAQTITSSHWLYYQWLHIVNYPSESQPSAFWSPKIAPTFWQKIVMKFLSYVHMTKINHTITRVFDFFGMGDNLLVVLKKPQVSEKVC